MKSCLEIKRSIPALGTFFEIKCIAKKSATGKTQNIITKAFAEVKKLENRLSFYQDQSDVAKINRAPSHKKIAIGPELAALLRVAIYLNKISDNIFNIIKPHQPFISMAEYIKLNGFNVTLSKKIKIDLGGIAKGFIVDKAVKFLIKNGVEGGIVNAGGDIRIFGNYLAPIHIRDPFDFTKTLALSAYVNKSIASSSISENSKKRGGKSSIYNKSSAHIIHATIIGENCVICDALTKVALINPDIAGELLEKINYNGIMVDKNGVIFRTRNEKTLQ